MKNIVYVENECFVGVTKEGLKFSNIKTKEKKCLTFDDIGTLVFDNRKCYLSERVIEYCILNHIGILFCDRSHSPLEMIETTYNQEHRYERLKKQLTLTSKVKKRIWRKIVIQKIENQARCLELNEANADDVALVRSVSNTVVDGDEHNGEAVAAKNYFKVLFGQSFKRGRTKDIQNASLNYGYAIIRAEIRRLLVMKGFEPSFGIHHESTANPYNLADDVIETYRPFVDNYIAKNILLSEDNEFDAEERRLLVRILLEKCVINGQVMHLSDAIHLTVDTLTTCIENNSSGNLKLPSFIEGGI